MCISNLVVMRQMVYAMHK